MLHRMENFPNTLHDKLTYCQPWRFSFATRCLICNKFENQKLPTAEPKFRSFYVRYWPDKNNYSRRTAVMLNLYGTRVYKFIIIEISQINILDGS